MFMYLCNDYMVNRNKWDWGDIFSMKWTVLENADEVANAACDRIVQASKLAIAARGEFHIVLAGGTTPASTYALLATTRCEWDRWHVWFGDERCLPRDHPDRNSVMVEATLLSKVDIPVPQVHVIPAELGPEIAAKQYVALIDDAPSFDMVLLGMGADGHTASLFPGQVHPKGDKVLPIFEAPKLPAQRVSLSAEVLGQCRELLFIITGKDKAAAVSRWQQGDVLPVGMINGCGKCEVIIDKLAFSG